MGKRKHPAPRGYDPGGFRFPGATPFKEAAGFIKPERLEQRGEAALQQLRENNVAALSAAATLAAVAIMRGRRGRGV